MNLHESPMFRDGPLPRGLHGAIEYIAGAFFVAAPFLFGFESDVAQAVSMAIGVIVIVVAALSAGPSGLVGQVPAGAHVVFDLVLAGFLIAAPFLLGFNDESTPTALFIVVGLVHLVVTLGTRFRSPAHV